MPDPKKRFFWNKKGKRVMWNTLRDENAVRLPYGSTTVVFDLGETEPIVVFKYNLEPITEMEVLARVACEPAGES